jgi:DNA replication protein DnaC
MSRQSSELAHLFRALKAPAAGRALPKLTDRARAEEWSFEQFAAALLKTETDSRDSHGGQGRIKAAKFPARKTLEDFDFAFQTSLRRETVLYLGQLDFLAGKENVVLLDPPGTGKTHLALAFGIRACLAGHRVAFRTATEWVALLADAQRQGRLDAELTRLQRIPLLIVDEVGYIPFDPQAANLMFTLVSSRSKRRLTDRHVQQAVQCLGRDLRRRHRRCRDDRPPRPTTPKSSPSKATPIASKTAISHVSPPPRTEAPRGERRAGSPSGLASAPPIANPLGIAFHPALRGQLRAALTKARCGIEGADAVVIPGQRPPSRSTSSSPGHRTQHRVPRP